MGKDSVSEAVAMDGKPTPKPRQRPSGWRGASIGRELLGAYYGAMFNSDIAELARAKDRAEERRGKLANDGDKIAYENYKRLITDYINLSNAWKLYTQNFCHGYFYFFALAGRECLKRYAFACELLPELDREAKLTPQKPREYAAIEPLLGGISLDGEGKEIDAAEMYEDHISDPARKAIALYTVARLYADSFLSPKDNLLPPEDIVELSEKADRVNTLIGSMGDYLKAVKPVGIDSLRPPAERVAEVKAIIVRAAANISTPYQTDFIPLVCYLTGLSDKLDNGITSL